MSTTVSNIAGTYRIELTAEQWAALRSVISYAEIALARDLRECEESEAFWLKRGDRPESLAVSRKNLVVRRQWLTEAQSVAPLVHGAKLVPTRKTPR